MPQNEKQTICVYCSSSNYLPEKFYTFGKELGKRLAQSGYNMVYGGTVVGMMGVIANNALENGAVVTGVIPKRIESFGLKHPSLAKVIVTENMRERKAQMEKLSDIFVAAPGGFGTFEEVFEIMVAKQLGYHNKPVIFLNFDNYYGKLFEMFETVYQNKFAKEEMKDLYFIANSLDEMFDYIKNYTPKEIVLKW